ncbi:cobalamin biosynthesis protein [Streptomyces violaceusniger]|uniref:Cobalamin (Vitamin B12) biosynthesis CbiG protein n=1 Tax=Streptomyces violaceusniger (strain Tu 4113) TaxID=653045 RepID=G2P6E7_STRV4|nr:cobalamin biosynthesis protein [Streptomyces violaceusniger]AEM86319.1 cobalamin (vitamin B12) biosynthesis CbiG protein [Streptomyces violaceusniger Tu 4113]
MEVIDRGTACPLPGAPLVVGVGASRGVSVAEVIGLVETALAEAGLSPSGVAELATVEAKAGEAGLLTAAERLGVPLCGYPAEVLASVEVPNPSAAPLTAVGTAGVAEAAALLAAGPGGELLVAKRKSTQHGRPGMATCAVARRPAAVKTGQDGPRRPAVDRPDTGQ